MRTKRTNDWPAVIAVLRARDTVSSADIARWAQRYTHISPDYALRHLRRKGLIRRLKTGSRGVYVVMRGTDDASVRDPVEAVLTVVGADVVFGYGSALLLHGLSRYARVSEYCVVSTGKRKPRRIGEMVLRFAKTPLQKEMGVMSLRRGPGSVRVTDLERTLIDCIHRPKYAQGWENVVHALTRAQKVKAQRMIEYLKHYRTPSLVAKVGWIIERHARQWNAPDRALVSLRPYLPRSPVAFLRGGGGKLDKTWNVYVPEGLLHE